MRFILLVYLPFVKCFLYFYAIFFENIIIYSKKIHTFLPKSGLFASHIEK